MTIHQLHPKGAPKETPSKEPPQEEPYRTTPKGFLAAKLCDVLSFDELEDLWMDFEEFVLEEAVTTGYSPYGLPCVVFFEGGVCGTLPEEEQL